MAQPNPPPILRLPPEILEKVFSYVAPCGNERYWDSLEPVPDHVLDWFAGWKDRCLAARATCRYFSQSTTLRKALFHTIYWFPTNAGLERIRSIAASYPEMVHNFSWYPPMFGYYDIDEETYHRQLREESIPRRRNALSATDLTWKEKEYCEQSLAKHFLPFDSRTITAGYHALQRHLMDQFFILQSEHTTIKLAQAFTRLPYLDNFTFHASCSIADDVFPQDLAAPQRSHVLEQHYPGVLIQGENRTYGVLHDPHVGAYSKVVNTTWTCGKKPQSFTIAQNTREIDTRSTYRQIPDVRQMRCFAAELSDPADNPKWIAALERNGRLLRNLQELRLGNGGEKVLSETLLPSLCGLKRMWLRDICPDEVSMLIDTFRALKSLDEVKFQNVTLVPDENSSAWPQVMSILRANNATKFEFHDLRTLDDDVECCHLEYADDKERGIELHEQLQAFVKGEGDWTCELEGEFNVVTNTEV